jgi:hypothetical protein
MFLPPLRARDRGSPMRSCSKSGKAIRIRLVPVNFCLQMEAAAQTDRRKVTLYLPVQRTAMSVDQKSRTKGRIYNYASFCLSDGFFARLRSLRAPATTAWAVYLGWLRLDHSLSHRPNSPVAIFTLLAVVELVAKVKLHVLGSATETAEIALMITPQQAVAASSTEVLQLRRNRLDPRNCPRDRQNCHLRLREPRSRC